MSLYLNDVEHLLLRALLDAHVRFLIVGGHAVQFHGHLRPAKDLDIFIERSQKNAARLTMVLSQVRININSEQEARFAKVKIQARLERIHNNIEILTSIDAVSFNEAFDQAVYSIENGLEIPVLSKDHLIKSKLARGENKDLEDIRVLCSDPSIATKMKS